MTQPRFGAPRRLRTPPAGTPPAPHPAAPAPPRTPPVREPSARESLRPARQFLKPRVAAQRVEIGIDAQPGRRQDVGDLQKRLELVHGLLRLTDDDVDPNELMLVVSREYVVLVERLLL